MSLLVVTYLNFGMGLKEIPVFIDVPSFAICAGIIVGGTLLAHGLRPVKLALYQSLVGYVETEEKARVAEDILTLGIRLSVLAGATGTLIGSINVLKVGLSDVNVLAQSLAQALLSLFYSLVFATIFAIARARLVRSLMRMRQAQCCGTANVQLICKRSLWTLILVPIVVVVLMGVTRFVLLEEVQNDCRLTIENDTPTAWTVFGEVVVTTGAMPKTSHVKDIWPEHLWPHGDLIKNMDHFIEGISGDTKLPSRYFLVFVDRSGLHKLIVEDGWPKGVSHLKLKLSDHIEPDTLSKIKRSIQGQLPAK